MTEPLPVATIEDLEAARKVAALDDRPAAQERWRALVNIHAASLLAAARRVAELESEIEQRRTLLRAASILAHEAGCVPQTMPCCACCAADPEECRDDCWRAELSAALTVFNSEAASFKLHRAARSSEAEGGGR